MKFRVILLLCAVVVLESACAGKKPGASAQVSAPKAVAVTTARAVVQHVAASFDETGTFVADEASDIAPPVAGRVIRTPVNVGAFVRES